MESPNYTQKTSVDSQESLKVDDSWLNKLANRMLGTPFRNGGRNEAEGFDCFGFCIDYYKRSDLGIKLRDPRKMISDSELARGGQSVIDLYKGQWKSISSKSIRPGDIVLISVDGKIIDHMGIILPKKWFIHALKEIGVIRSYLPDWKTKIRRYLRYVSDNN